MGKIWTYCAWTTMTLFIGYAAVSAAINTQASPWYLTTLLVASILAGVICLVTGVIYLWQYKKESSHKALVQSFKRLGLTDKQAEDAAMDNPPSPPIEGEEEWVSPREAYKKHKKNKNP
ncbi:MAG: hypothetical protein PHN78_02640 [Dehalococcoidales bacterium]|nr:hypothetical protein [Dehalococcoidales bacterium]